MTPWSLCGKVPSTIVITGPHHAGLETIIEIRRLHSAPKNLAVSGGTRADLKTAHQLLGERHSSEATAGQVACY